MDRGFIGERRLRARFVARSGAAPSIGSRQDRLERWGVSHLRVSRRPGFQTELRLATATEWTGSFGGLRSEEHTSELQSLMRNSYAVFCLKKKKIIHSHT